VKAQQTKMEEKVGSSKEGAVKGQIRARGVGNPVAKHTPGKSSREGWKKGRGTKGRSTNPNCGKSLYSAPKRQKKKQSERRKTSKNQGKKGKDETRRQLNETPDTRNKKKKKPNPEGRTITTYQVRPRKRRKFQVAGRAD